jgi:anti-sigma B factor antagonist
MHAAEREVWLGADRRTVPTGRNRGLRLALAPDPAGGGGFVVTVTSGRHRTVVRPVGELDLSTADQLEASLDDVLATGTSELVLDLRRLEFCDAAGLHVFLRVRRRAAGRGARLWLERPTRTVRRVLEVSELGWLLDEPADPGESPA